MPRVKRRRKNVSKKVNVPGAKTSIEKMKYEIANEFGVNLGANASSHDNGLVGGEITKRLVEHSMNRSSTSKTSNSKAKKRSRKSSK